MKKTALALFAHPDDEAFGPSGTLAVLAKEYDIHLVCATRGEAGENHHPDRNTRALSEIRSEELKNSARILGVREVIFLDYPDGNLSNIHYNQFLAKTELILQAIQPERLITFETNGLTGHMDHIFVSKIATSLFDRNPEVQMLMYHCFDTHTQQQIQDYYRQKDFNVYFPPGVSEDRADIAIDVSDVWHQKRYAMNAHISQKLDREAFLRSMNEDRKKELFLLKTR